MATAEPAFLAAEPVSARARPDRPTFARQAAQEPLRAAVDCCRPGDSFPRPRCLGGGHHLVRRPPEGPAGRLPAIAELPAVERRLCVDPQRLFPRDHPSRIAIEYQALPLR